MSTPAAQQAYTVLRIKRKATEPPLSSLVISDPGPAERARKRHASVRQRGVFRLAETVPETWQGMREERSQLQTRIKGLMSGSALPSPPATELSASPAAPAASASAAPTPPSPAETSQVPSANAAPPAPAASAKRVQFRVVPRARAPPATTCFPPRVLSRAEADAAASDLVFIDAQAVGDALARGQGKGKGRSLPPDPDEEAMKAFLPMLEEYLTLEQKQKEEDDEYVYDLYYRDTRTDAPLDSASVGALLGYDDLSPPSSPSDSEVEDEADEDSNDEDYYRNDYPEDEDADEDMEGFEDAYADEDYSGDDDSGQSNGGGGGEWNYR
ncbi:hypothetical protein Q5752_004492 [Cryptotrichosporon argae]